MLSADALLIGWDLGGAHVKASLLQGGELRDVAQWACALWQGLDRLDAVLTQAAERWPALTQASHAVTMTGEMTDLFAGREQGVVALARRMALLPGRELRFYAGPERWCSLEAVAEHWPQIASANWQATAALAARAVDDGVLVDIGSTTTDLIALRAGRALPRGLDDAGRLATGELVYHGVVRTPLCALARRIAFRGVQYHVMNEFFATTADVYRATGELQPEDDLQPAADNGAKDLAATHIRLARMIGMDARDAAAADWRDFAMAWREQQLDVIESALREVIAAAALPPRAPLVSAGCGEFLAAELARRLARPIHSFASLVLPPDADPALARSASVCAPSVAVALLAAAVS